MKSDALDIAHLHNLQQRIAQGNPAAFKQLFEHFADQLSRFSFAIIRDKEAAIDMMHSVFIKIWNNRAQLADVDNLNVYLYTAVKNTSLNYLASKAKQATDSFDSIDIAVDKSVQPDVALISKESFRLIAEAVESLPPRCKMIFKLVREDGLSYKEVAQILQLSVNTVDAQMVIAVKKISEKVLPSLDISPMRKIKKLI